jgi:endonuclease/exonuclease/phosphatase family metal-dependent hydrolase
LRLAKGKTAMKLLRWDIQWGRGMDGRVDLGRILTAIRQIGGFDVMPDGIRRVAAQNRQS